MDYLNGVVGQVSGDFAAGEDIINIIKKKDKIKYFYGLKKLGVIATQGDVMIIDGQEITMSRSGIYELDHVKYIQSLKFKNNVSNVTIDYVY